jgi:hypothetical protein
VDHTPTSERKFIPGIEGQRPDCVEHTPAYKPVDNLISPANQRFSTSLRNINVTPEERQQKIRRELEYQAGLRQQIEEKRRKKEKEKRNEDRVKQREYEEYMRNNFKDNRVKTEKALARKNTDLSSDNVLQFKADIYDICSRDSDADASLCDSPRRLNDSRNVSMQDESILLTEKQMTRERDSYERSFRDSREYDDQQNHYSGLRANRHWKVNEGGGGIVKHGIDVFQHGQGSAHEKYGSPRPQRDPRHFEHGRDDLRRNRRFGDDQGYDHDSARAVVIRERLKRDKHMEDRAFRNESNQGLDDNPPEVEDTVPGKQYDELSTLCDRLLSQQEAMQEEIAEQANVIKQLLADKKRAHGRMPQRGEDFDDESITMLRSKSSRGRIERISEKKIANGVVGAGQGRPRSSERMRQRRGSNNGPSSVSTADGKQAHKALFVRKKTPQKVAFGGPIEPTKRRVPVDAPKPGARVTREKSYDGHASGLAKHGEKIVVGEARASSRGKPLTKGPVRPPGQPTAESRRDSMYDINGRRLSNDVASGGGGGGGGFRALAQRGRDEAPLVASFEASQSVELEGDSMYVAYEDDLISADQLDRLLARARGQQRSSQGSHPRRR